MAPSAPRVYGLGQSVGDRRGGGLEQWNWRRWLSRCDGLGRPRQEPASGEGVTGEALGVNTGAGVLGANDAGGIGIGVYGRAKANGNRAGFFDGGITVVNGAKSFVEPHPTDPTKQIRFAALEGPESGTYFRGTGRTVNGFATIEVPEAFRMVTDEKGPDGHRHAHGRPRGRRVREEIARADRDPLLAGRGVRLHGQRRPEVPRGLEPIEENTFFIPTSPTDPVLTRPLPKETVARLISNGTLNPDGSINMNTVRRLGWDKREAWKEREPVPDGEVQGTGTLSAVRPGPGSIPPPARRPRPSA